MPIERLVVNASPLITLFRSGLEEILPALCPHVVVPDTVWQEVIEGGHQDAAAIGLNNTNWAIHRPAETVETVVQAWDLGAGESAVLSFARTHPDFIAVLDDAAARQCGRALEVRVIGTGGLLVQAKREGIIPSVAGALRELKKAGLWLAPEIEQMLLEIAHEGGVHE
ncbi:MAG: DUF3368 domain-containing protein [Pseudomonadota bacterium]|nr:DUF3368 domain-containing protein [Pseudomonadota bacterium]